MNHCPIDQQKAVAQMLLQNFNVKMLQVYRYDGGCVGGNILIPKTMLAEMKWSQVFRSVLIIPIHIRSGCL